MELIAPLSGSFTPDGLGHTFPLFNPENPVPPPAAAPEPSAGALSVLTAASLLWAARRHPGVTPAA